MNGKRLFEVGMTVLLFGTLWSTGALALQETKVDLNQADQTQLETLPGIGPALAKRIVQFRSENGRFQRIEDLMNVRGIGEKKFLNLKEFITVGGGSAKAKKPKGS